LASISSNGTGGGNSDDTAAWADGVVPIEGDDVTIVSGGRGKTKQQATPLKRRMLREDEELLQTTAIVASTDILDG